MAGRVQERAAEPGGDLVSVLRSAGLLASSSGLLPPPHFLYAEGENKTHDKVQVLDPIGLDLASVTYFM